MLKLSVREKINAFEKLKIEAEYQQYSSGGAISYVESPNMQNNIPALLNMMKYMYNNIMYAEINSKSDYCQNCGFDGEIQLVGPREKLYWRCPNCGCEDERFLNVARRTCGLIK